VLFVAVPSTVISHSPSGHDPFRAAQRELWVCMSPAGRGVELERLGIARNVCQGAFSVVGTQADGKQRGVRGVGWELRAGEPHSRPDLVPYRTPAAG